ncbi:MAG: 1-acyl-sn-glycerol-3-phosphate acyltransferase [Bacteroidetes bacterium]|jgi:1-acyl-sn-glycerol-3-phosphate acyltransferase|nr:1-acyl-sn-glycerol-3-phosphate acyltransferase [Bacteroidota bacterium]
MAKSKSSQHIKKPAFLYHLLYYTLRFYYQLYYRRITIIGLEKIPENNPVIFAPNHQNALMDALAVLFAVDKPLLFLARSDIFKKPIIARALYFLRILPVYRLHDGLKSLEKNKAVFSETVQLLQNGSALTIMPEGTHSAGKQLQPLKKGTARIAFQTAEADGFKSPIVIVPFGIDYEHPNHAGKQLFLNVGNAISVDHYYEQYKNDPQKAIKNLTAKLQEALKNQLIHLDDLKCEDCHRLLTKLSCSKTVLSADPQLQRFRKEQKIADQFNKLKAEQSAELQWIITNCHQYLSLLKTHKLHETSSKHPLPSTVGLLMDSVFFLLLFPVQLYGTLVNYLPYKIPVLISNKLKDKQFISSVNFGLSFLLFPLWYVLLFVVLLLISNDWLLSMFASLSWPYAGLMAFYQYKNGRKLGNKWRWKLLSLKSPKLMLDLMRQRQTLIDWIDQL